MDADIAVIGAGAAGLAAGIFAAETRSDLRIILLDGAKNIGAKILVSGGGRCNVTNAHVRPADFHGDRRFIARVLRRFDEQATVRWFESLGVPLKQESTDKLFPVSNKARTVLSALQRRCADLGVRILSQHRVNTITPSHGGFAITHEHGSLTARAVILATGGRSLPKTGSDGHGYAIARQLGHTITATFPALVPLVLEDTFFHAGLTGISHDVEVMTRLDGKIIDRRTGSLLWTHFGVSGPVVLDASRFWVGARRQGRRPLFSLNVFPGQTFEDIDEWLGQAAKLPGRKTVGSLFAQRLPDRVAKTLCDYLDSMLNKEPLHSPERLLPASLDNFPVNRLPRTHRQLLAHTLTNLALPVIADRGWNFAEVTAGGIPLDEVNASTMASRIVPGLYLIGEILDCDGRIGGFNFQWVWATGHIAGCSAARACSPSHST